MHWMKTIFLTFLSPVLLLLISIRELVKPYLKKEYWLYDDPLIREENIKHRERNHKPEFLKKVEALERSIWGLTGELKNKQYGMAMFSLDVIEQTLKSIKADVEKHMRTTNQRGSE